MTREEIDLIENNYKLVYFVVNKYFKKLNIETKEDLVSEGFLSLVRKAKYYNPDRGSFSTFIVRTIYLDLIRYLQTHVNKHTSEVSLNDNIAEDLTYMDIISDNQDDLKYVDLYDSLNKLPKQKYKIITEVFLEGKSQVEVAREMGISRQRINVIVNQTLNELKENLKNNEKIRNKEKEPPIEEISKTLGFSTRTYFRKKAKGINVEELYKNKLSSEFTTV